MNRFSNILMVYDDTLPGEETLGRVIELAEKNKAQLTFFKVIEAIPPEYHVYLSTYTPEKIKQIAIQNHVNDMEHHIRKFYPRDSIVIKVVEGNKCTEIIKKVLRDEHDLLIKIVRKTRTDGTMPLDSTAVDLLSKCPCPVFLLRTQPKRLGRHIMVAVNMMTEEHQEESRVSEQNRAVLELSISLARLMAGKLSIVHTWCGYDFDLEFHGRKDTDLLQRQKQNIHIASLDTLMAQLNFKQIEYQEYVVEGQAEDVIPDFVVKNKVDILVMTTVDRVGTPGLLIENGAETILDGVECSVLAVKPAGCTPPVQLNKKEIRYQENNGTCNPLRESTIKFSPCNILRVDTRTL